MSESEPALTRREVILGIADDAGLSFDVWDFPRDQLEEALRSGEVTLADIAASFAAGVRDALCLPGSASLEDMTHEIAFCSVTWNGEVHKVKVPVVVSAALVLEAFLGEHPALRPQRLALFSEGGVELEPHEAVREGDELILRPRVVH